PAPCRRARRRALGGYLRAAGGRSGPAPPPQQRQRRRPRARHPRRSPVKPSRVPLATALMVLLFFYLPIAMLVVQSFNAAKFGGQWDGFSLRWYEELWRREDIHHATWNTLLIALSSTLLSVVLGALAAWCLHRYRSRLQRVHHGLIYAPLVVP